MATETPCTPNHSHSKTKDLDEELSRSDLSESPDDIYEMTPASTRKRSGKRQRRIIDSDDESEIDRKTSITDSVENVSISPEVVRSSSKKKKHVLCSESEDSGEEPLGVTPGFNASGVPGTAVRRVTKNLEDAFRKSEFEDDTPEFYGTASAQKAKREKALEALRKRRERRAGGLLGTSLDNDYNDDSSVSPAKLFKNNLIEDTIEKDQEEEEEEEEEDLGSDLEGFIVEDSQSQELPVFAKLELEEAYKRLVQMYLSSILDRDFLSLLQDEQDPYFEEAKDTIDKVIESKKNLVGSTTWKKFKKMLESCSVLESHNITRKPIKKDGKCIEEDKCEACLRKPRNLMEHIMFFSTDCNGVKELPLEMEFSVGCFCAERGSLYHDLHHHKFQLKQSCTEKINKSMEAMGNESDPNMIVECCIKDEEWLSILFKTFEALLNKADKWAEDGEKRKQMKAYCASFH